MACCLHLLRGPVAPTQRVVARRRLGTGRNFPYGSMGRGSRVAHTGRLLDVELTADISLDPVSESPVKERVAAIDQ